MPKTNQLAEYERILKRTPTGEWVLEFPDLPGCRASGATSELAFQNGEVALADFVARANAARMKLPAPGSSRQASGNIKLRVPAFIHARVYALSQCASMSLSAVVLRLLYAGVNRLRGEGQAAEPCVEASGERLPLSSAANKNDGERSFSGVWVQRLPRELHVQLQWIAGEQKVSHNLLINSLIASELGLCEGRMQAHRTEVPSGVKRPRTPQAA
tara:strand:+ start:12180 stop:12824 length:645 start_codon:yes stop_codon:yes gene_type:complete